jgi:hypothetical protein
VIEPLKGPAYPVELTSEELEWAYHIGELRNEEAKRRGLKDKHGLSAEDALRVHQVGAAGEAAFAKFAGVDWDASVNTFKKKADVAGFEIRTRTKRRLRPLDP